MYLPYQAVLTGAAWLLQEVKLLERIELACEEQLAATFENYSSLSEDSPSGLAENGAPTPEQPAPALRPAVGLCSKRHQPHLHCNACIWIPSEIAVWRFLVVANGKQFCRSQPCKLVLKVLATTCAAEAMQLARSLLQYEDHVMDPISLGLKPN